ncbi:hypothetical protein Pvag_pPag20089 (plasmid) [Pantoea vagans C9-1]|nr:hypothetical protein Pvag_pPag20089 [Pantoea vagans C9-1]
MDTELAEASHAIAWRSIKKYQKKTDSALMTWRNVPACDDIGCPTRIYGRSNLQDRIYL